MAFEKGNQLAAKRREFQKKMRAAIEQDDWKRVRAGIEVVLNLCATGERWALELVRDTLDGKPVSQIEAHDADGTPLAVAIIAYDPLQVRAAPVPAPGPARLGFREEESGSGLAS
jgi:hypothetical protein